MNILLVDDQQKPREEARQALETILDRPTIHEFNNAEDALAAFSPSVDLVVTDIVMPVGNNGVELARDILKQRTLPILFHTGSWSKDYLYNFVMNGAVDKLPMEIAIKLYTFPGGFKEYAAEFQTQLEKVLHKGHIVPDIAILDRMIEKLKTREDTLVDYVKIVYKELVGELNAAAHQLPEELAKKILATKWDYTQDSTTLFMHTARYPLGALALTLQGCEDAAINSIYQQMSEISDLINDSLTRYSPSLPAALKHEKSLQAAERIDLPKTAEPVKLRNREIVLAHTVRPLVAIYHDDEPEDYVPKLQAVFDVTGKAIFRSMHRSEDSQNPLAGFFHSEVVDDISKAAGAIENVRTEHSSHLEPFCLYRGFNLPSAEDMVVGAEPFLETKYLGSALQHPNDENLLLIEFHQRIDKKKEKKFFVLYDVSKGHVMNNVQVVPEEIDAETLGKNVSSRLAKSLDHLQKAGISYEGTAVQMEIGFNDTLIYDLQIREFWKRRQIQDFEVENRIRCSGLFGATSEEGIQMAVTSTNEPEILALLSENCRRDGLKVCYVIKKNVPPNLATYIDNLGLVVLGRGIGVQEHGYFNAMSNADNVLLLSSQAAFTDLALEPGSIINYASNGTSTSIARIDQSDSLKYAIRDRLNGRSL